jgi:hypothetical protein
MIINGGRESVEKSILNTSADAITSGDGTMEILPDTTRRGTDRTKLKLRMEC